MNGKTIVTMILLLLICVGTVAGVYFADHQEQDSKQDQEDVFNNENENSQPENTDGETTQPDAQPEESEQEEYQKLAAEFAKEKEEYYLLLANVDHPLPESFTVETETVQNNYQLDSRVAPYAKEMIQAAANDGVELLVCSAYRSIEKQTTLFNNMKQDYLNQGLSESEAYNKTANAIAIPGTSEHQTGLAADIVTPSHQTLDEAFADTAAGQWLLEHAHEYGFVLRYPKDKEDVTKIMYESWHFRYVGKKHAELMKESGMCLEEYLAQEVPEGYTLDE